MAKTYAKPYLQGFGLNLATYKAKEVGGLGARQAATTQSPGLSVDLGLYLGSRYVGYQTYYFGTLPSTATESHSGLPAFKQVVPQEVIDAWIAALEVVTDTQLPEFSDEAPESKAGGPLVGTKIVRIECRMPWDQPKERYVAVVVGLYEDAACTRQIVNSDIVLTFAEDAYVLNRLQMQESQMTAEGMAQVRAQNMIFPLKGFLGQPGVLPGVGGMLLSLLTVLKKYVFQYKDIDPAAIMAAFTLPPDVMPEVEPEPEPE